MNGDDRDGEIEALRRTIAALEARIERLEEGQAAGRPAFGEKSEMAEVERIPVEEAFTISGAEQVEAAEPEAPIAFTGALRYNLVLTQDNLDSKKGETGLDIFRVGASGSVDNITVSAEYRFFSYMDTLKHGWIGYDIPGAGELQAGVTQVPFGILPYASHNFWFGVPYYVGLADDYDLGVKYAHTHGNWDFHLGFFKNEELGSAADLERYSFDLVRVGPEQNEEVNQLNARVAYAFGRGTSAVHELGLSLQAGQIYNGLTDARGSRWAAGVHLDSRVDRWNFQLQLARYAFDPENPAGMGRDTVRLGAFAGSYDLAAEGTLGVANVAYNLPITWPGVDSLLVYNDFSILFKDETAFDESILNTTGAAMGVGPLFLYLDLIQARNMVYFEDGSLAGEGNDSWSSRLNLNVGYYW